MIPILANTSENRVHVVIVWLTIFLPYSYSKVSVPAEVSVFQDGWPRDPPACPFIFQHVHAVWFRERSLQEQTHILHSSP